jgi:integrase
MATVNGKRDEQREPVYRDGRNVPYAEDGPDRKFAEKFLRDQIKDVHADEKGGPAFVPPANRRLTVNQLLDGLQAALELRHKYKENPGTVSHMKRARETYGDYAATALTEQKIDAIREQLRADGFANATINRRTQPVLAAFKLAVDRRILNRVPAIKMLDESDNVRRVTATEEQLDTWRAALTYRGKPDTDLQDVYEWAYEANMRAGETKKLTWNMLIGDVLNIPRGITKKRKFRIVPIATKAMQDIIARRQKLRRPDLQYIFHRNGKKVSESWREIRRACRIAGMPDDGTRQGRFVPHSQRSIAFSHGLKSGVPVPVLYEIGGWSQNSKMAARYGLIDTDPQAEAMRQVAAYREKQRKQAEAASEKVQAIR